MKINWVLQINLVRKEIIEEIKRALHLDNISYEEVSIVPFSDELPAVFNDQQFNVFYGSTTLILNAYRNASHARGVFYDRKAFSFENYLAKWGARMLNHDAILTTFPAFAAANHPDSSEWFLRPNHDDKSFSGCVMTFAEIKQMAAGLTQSNNPHLTDDTRIAVSAPKAIQKEWRHFIVNKKIISSSRYALNQQLDISLTDVPNELLEFVAESCEAYVPHAIFVMDTALADGIFSIIECNCFNGTGFYKHDIGKIVRSVNEHLHDFNL